MQFLKSIILENQSNSSKLYFQEYLKTKWNSWKWWWWTKNHKKFRFWEVMFSKTGVSHLKVVTLYFTKLGKEKWVNVEFYSMRRIVHLHWKLVFPQRFSRFKQDHFANYMGKRGLLSKSCWGNRELKTDELKCLQSWLHLRV